jgi:hypothetical protein
MARYEQMSKTADRFASDPIVIAKAIQRAVETKRPSARYVAPFSTNAVIWFSRLFPTSVWDWAMRTAGFLSAKSLGVTGPAPQGPGAHRSIDMGIPTETARAKTPEGRAAMN